MSWGLRGVVAPITAVVAAALPTGVGVMTGERLHAGQIAGIAIGLVAIAMINRVGRGSTHGTRTAVGLAVLAGIGFGLFFILFHAGSGAGVTAFVSGRVGLAADSFGLPLGSGVTLRPRRGTWRLLAAMRHPHADGGFLFFYTTLPAVPFFEAVFDYFYS